MTDQDKTLNGAIDDAMKTDPLWEAEKKMSKVLGKNVSYKDEGAVGKIITGMGFRGMLQLSQTKRELAAMNRDTHFSSKLNDYLAVVEDLGFKLMLKLEIPKYGYRETDHQYIYATDDGLVLCFDSYRGDVVNGGSVYFNWANNDPDNPAAPISGSGGTDALDKEANTILKRDFKYEYDHETRTVTVDEWADYLKDGGWTIWVGNFDCREFLRRKVEALRSRGELLKTWAKRPFLWFLHYNDTRCPSCNSDHNRCICYPAFKYDYKAITQKRIEMADPRLAEIVGD